MLNWADQFNICSFLDSHHYPFPFRVYDFLLAAGEKNSLRLSSEPAFAQLKLFHDKHQDWIFGHFGYELNHGNSFCSTQHFDGIGFEDIFFFQPEILLLGGGNDLKIGIFGDRQEAAKILDQINHTPAANSDVPQNGPVHLRQRMSQSEYLQAVEGLKGQMRSGNCYEVNFCQEFFLENIRITPTLLYRSLSQISPVPFAGYYKVGNHYLISSSPERFLQKVGERIISQPIKGTAPRGFDFLSDAKIKEELGQSSKERAENVMVVDLVRNDLARTAREGTVSVSELFGIYTFPQVHQMISTICSEQDPQYHWTEVIQAAFPMGSMTGAPKIKVMELIQEYERTRRGLYSGSLGYVTAEGDFDFNVVIRSFLYNSSRQFLSFQTGSAITVTSDPLQEWAECCLKASALIQALEQSHGLSLLGLV
ncbi:MAG: anthranilate synthase component I family protein [Chitinophagaceae bacterium]